MHGSQGKQRPATTMFDGVRPSSTSRFLVRTVLCGPHLPSWIPIDLSAHHPRAIGTKARPHTPHGFCNKVCSNGCGVEENGLTTVPPAQVKPS